MNTIIFDQDALTGIAILRDGDSIRGVLHVGGGDAGVYTGISGRQVRDWAWKVLDEDLTIIDQSSESNDPIHAFFDDDGLNVLSSFVGFLMACVEAKNDESENYNLFSQPVREWAEMVSDSLSILGSDLEDAETSRRD